MLKVATNIYGSLHCWAMAMLFGQAELAGAFGGTGILSVLIQAGSFGLIAYLIVMGLPTMQRELKDERKQERVDFMAALRVVTEGCREEVNGARAEVERVREIFQTEQRELRATFATEMEAMRRMYVESLNAFRTAVHDVKDVAGVTMNRANTAIMRADIEKGKGVTD